MVNVLRRFVDLNAALSDRLQPSFVTRTHAYTRYQEVGAALLRREPAIVLDVGAGRQWHFTPALKGANTTLIGFDIDESEMSGNMLLDRRVSGDACTELGVSDGSVDLIMGRAVVEHLHDTASFLHAANRALRPDGLLIVTFANRNAPFALMNRLLPKRVSNWLLDHLYSGSAGVLGFEAFYDCADFHDFKRCLANAGFEVEEEFSSYFSTSYYRFFVPLFVAGLGFDYLRHLIANPRLASYFMFVARKHTAVPETKSAVAPLRAAQ